MKIVITNDSIMYNRGSEAVIRSIALICRFWHPESEIVVVTGREGEILKDIRDADRVVPKFDATGGLTYLLEEVSDADVVLVTGADNYDYGTDNYQMIGINDAIFSHTKAKTILYDCSLNANNLSEAVFKDMNRFSVVTVRERKTEKLFLDKFAKDKVYYYPDPAFLLPMEKCSLPYGFDEYNTIGINISNLIMGKRVGAPEEIVLSNYKKVVDYILRQTDSKVLIIQHVMNNGYDLEAAQKLYKGYENEARVSILQTEQLNAMQIKFVISKLRMLVTARTHASIAAYSTHVPTLVVGYSVKSEGIAEDIFGDCDNSVVQVRGLNYENDLLDKFKFMVKNENEIRTRLANIMPMYKKKALEFGKILL